MGERGHFIESGAQLCEEDNDILKSGELMTGRVAHRSRRPDPERGGVTPQPPVTSQRGAGGRAGPRENLRSRVLRAQRRTFGFPVLGRRPRTRFCPNPCMRSRILHQESMKGKIGVDKNLKLRFSSQGSFLPD